MAPTSCIDAKELSIRAMYRQQMEQRLAEELDRIKQKENEMIRREEARKEQLERVQRLKEMIGNQVKEIQAAEKRRSVSKEEKIKMEIPNYQEDRNNELEQLRVHQEAVFLQDAIRHMMKDVSCPKEDALVLERQKKEKMEEAIEAERRKLWEDEQRRELEAKRKKEYESLQELKRKLQEDFHRHRNNVKQDIEARKMREKEANLEKMHFKKQLFDEKKTLFEKSTQSSGLSSCRNDTGLIKRNCNMNSLAAKFEQMAQKTKAEETEKAKGAIPSSTCKWTKPKTFMDRVFSKENITNVVPKKLLRIKSRKNKEEAVEEGKCDEISKRKMQNYLISRLLLHERMDDVNPVAVTDDSIPTDTIANADYNDDKCMQMFKELVDKYDQPLDYHESNKKERIWQKWRNKERTPEKFAKIGTLVDQLEQERQTVSENSRQKNVEKMSPRYFDRLSSKEIEKKSILVIIDKDAFERTTEKYDEILYEPSVSSDSNEEFSDQENKKLEGNVDEDEHNSVHNIESELDNRQQECITRENRKKELAILIRKEVDKIKDLDRLIFERQTKPVCNKEGRKHCKISKSENSWYKATTPKWIQSLMQEHDSNRIRRKKNTKNNCLFKLNKKDISFSSIKNVTEMRDKFELDEELEMKKGTNMQLNCILQEKVAVTKSRLYEKTQILKRDSPSRKIDCIISKKCSNIKETFEAINRKHDEDNVSVLKEAVQKQEKTNSKKEETLLTLQPAKYIDTTKINQYYLDDSVCESDASISQKQKKSEKKRIFGKMFDGLKRSSSNSCSSLTGEKRNKTVFNSTVGQLSISNKEENTIKVDVAKGVWDDISDPWERKAAILAKYGFKPHQEKLFSSVFEGVDTIPDHILKDDILYRKYMNHHLHESEDNENILFKEKSKPTPKNNGGNISFRGKSCDRMLPGSIQCLSQKFTPSSDSSHVNLIKASGKSYSDLESLWRDHCNNKHPIPENSLSYQSRSVHEYEETSRQKNRLDSKRSKCNSCLDLSEQKKYMDLDKSTLTDVASNNNLIKAMFESKGPKYKFGRGSIGDQIGGSGNDVVVSKKLAKPSSTFHRDDRKWVLGTISKYFDVILETDEPTNVNFETTCFKSTQHMRDMLSSVITKVSSSSSCLSLIGKELAIKGLKKSLGHQLGSLCSINSTN